MVRRQSVKVKIFLSVIAIIASLVLLRFLVRDHAQFFVASEAIHMVGIMVLVFKLITQKTCDGLSLKSQQLTAMFLAARLICSFSMENDIHTVLDFETLVSTLWVIYMMSSKLKHTYIKELDSSLLYFTVVPAALLSLLVHPNTSHFIVYRVLWAFCVYLESVSVLPQLWQMQNTKIVEPFTAHYVFALGVARFLGCAHWIIKVIEKGGSYLFLSGRGYLWLPMVLIAEMLQTFILADFCYYYVKSILNGQFLTRIPSMV